MCLYRLTADTMRSDWQAPNGDVASRYLVRAFIAFALCFLFLVAVAALFLNEFVYLIAAGGLSCSGRRDFDAWIPLYSDARPQALIVCVDRECV
jgi:hypothetical protein